MRIFVNQTAVSYDLHLVISGHCETSRSLVGSSTDGMQGVVAVCEAVGRGEDVAGVQQHSRALTVAPVYR